MFLGKLFLLKGRLNICVDQENYTNLIIKKAQVINQFALLYFILYLGYFLFVSNSVVDLVYYISILIMCSGVVQSN